MVQTKSCGRKAFEGFHSSFATPNLHSFPKHRSDISEDFNIEILAAVHSSERKDYNSSLSHNKEFINL